MPFHVLGFNCTHDASAALLRDGIPVAAVEEERLSRVKHHFGMPERAVAKCLEMGGIGIDAVDASSVRTDFIGHGYFAESTSVLADLKKLLLEEATPALRNLLPGQLANLRYWIIPKPVLAK